MLKTRWANETWLVHQPDHARVSGFLAAHWGNHEFARPGHYAPSPAPDLYREQVVQAIAEHDNGWWEWEAAPEIDPADGLPLNLPDVGRNTRDAGLKRWRLGVPRLQDRCPYASLLISQHAYWLYAFAFDDLPGLNDALRHPIFGRAGTAKRLVNAPELTREFLSEQAKTQKALVSQLQRDAVFAAAVAPEHLLPHVRLLQTMDALSLLISFGGQQEHCLHDIPRGNWDDRIMLKWSPAADRRIVCAPYPFDLDPLEVHLPVRVVSNQTSDQRLTPMVQLHASPLQTIAFQLCS